MDGKLNDASWEKSVELSDFIIWSRDSYVKDAVTVFLCHDEKNLYIAFRSIDPAAGDLTKTVSPKGPRDTFLWGRNYVMVGIGNKDVSLRLMADPKETMTDWKNNDINWNGTWQYRASINQADWTAEFSIPLSEFGLNALSANEKLTISLSRSFPNGESGNWSGVCSLSGPATQRCQYGRWPDPVPGKNWLAFNAQNFGKENLNLICELGIDSPP